MKEQLVNYKTAKLAKEKGFNEICETAYGRNADSLYYGNCTHKNSENIFLSAPTQSLLQKWLREEKDVLVEVIFSNRLSRKLYEAAHEKPSLNFSWKIYTSIKDPEHIFNEFWSDGTFETYEEALEEGLQKALKMVR